MECTAFNAQDAQAVYRAIFERRDMRHFSGGCVAPEVLCRFLGLGWVSMFEPEQVATLVGLPEDAQAIALLCLGPVEALYDQPMLERDGWAQRAPLAQLVFDNQWQRPSSLFLQQSNPI